jgi:hypothetical protein
MSTLIINSDKISSKILAKHAIKLGAEVYSLNDELYEDFALGNMIRKAKTVKRVAKSTILKKLAYK